MGQALDGPVEELLRSISTRNSLHKEIINVFDTTKP
jgi:hypothetical protein